MNLRLRPLTREECQKARYWRNDWRETLRTPYLLTVEQQDKFYDEIVCNRNSPHRYWSLVIVWDYVGMGGLTFIQWENCMAEISLILNPDNTGKGIGEGAVDLLLAEAFNTMNLKTVIGECFHCNKVGVAFWEKIVAKYDAYATRLPNRKFWNGTFWDSLYFSIDAEDWRDVHDAPVK